MTAPVIPKYAEKYKTVKVEIHANGVAVATLDAKDSGNCNLLTGRLFKDFCDMVRNVAKDQRIRVLVCRSADEDFWMAHLDVTTLFNDPLTKEENGPLLRGEVMNEWHTVGEILRNMPKATIAEITGRVGGGGHEFSLGFDMRFGVYGKTKICQMEVPLGILPGGGGCVNLHRFLGAGRTMEVVLGGDDLDAETAERWGLLNRCFHDVASCRAHVDALAARIAKFPVTAVQEAKASVLAAERLPHTEALIENLWCFYRSTRGPEAMARMKAFIEAGGQKRAGELDLQNTLSKL
jgi:enoyl-CoA hydratase/carnithine racemase